jgi:hypothetical protein
MPSRDTVISLEPSQQYFSLTTWSLCALLCKLKSCSSTPRSLGVLACPRSKHLHCYVRYCNSGSGSHSNSSVGKIKLRMLCVMDCTSTGNLYEMQAATAAVLLVQVKLCHTVVAC